MANSYISVEWTSANGYLLLMIKIHPLVGGQLSTIEHVKDSYYLQTVITGDQSNVPGTVCPRLIMSLPGHIITHRTPGFRSCEPVICFICA